MPSVEAISTKVEKEMHPYEAFISKWMKNQINPSVVKDRVIC